jgi:hypothetical protein
MKEINTVALFRLSVLGALVSPEQLGRKRPPIRIWRNRRQWFRRRQEQVRG